MKNTYEDKILNADIMLAGDSAEDHYMLVQILNDKGYKVRRETSADAALAAVKIKKPDLIILDLMLPKMDGYKICRMLKFDEKYKKIPIIMFTARAQDKDKKLGQEVGADAYITKPFDSKDLLDKISALLKK